jgi:3-hydroxyisobutyrate dehydrogenase-like beta-hydroxyacid dehydrogenase
MGAPIARHLAAAGLAVTVWNRTEAKAEPLRAAGIAVASAPTRAVENVDAVGIILTDERAVTDVLITRGLLGALRDGALVVEMSTTSVAAKLRFAALVRQSGGRAVDAPLFGSRAEAERGALWPVVGANMADRELAEAFLNPFSDRIFHVGDVGAGAAMKLAGNVLVLNMVANIAEAIALLRAHDVDPEHLLTVLSTTSFGSPFYIGKGRLMINGDYEPRASIEIAAKDLQLILAAARAAGLQLPSTQALGQLFDAARERGDGSKDMAALIEVLWPRVG